jgi:hypothetical protein
MSKSKHFRGFDIVQRCDGSYAVYDYAWWPDSELDSDPALNAKWLEATGGWRAKGWQVVYVAKSYREAHNWCYHAAKRRTV